MSTIVRTYEMDSAWYAQVQLSDGTVVELKARKGEGTGEPDWLARATEFEAALSEQLSQPSGSIVVEAEDGTIV